MPSAGKVDTALIDDFVVVNSSGSLVAGLNQGDFTVQLYNPARVDVSGSVSVTISELADGNYRTSFTPDAAGDWLLLVKHATHFPAGKRAQYAIISRALFIDAPHWLDEPLLDDFVVVNSSGALVAGLSQGDFTVQLYNPSGDEVSGSISVSISELGGGDYRTSFTPDVIGDWLLVIKHATYCAAGKRGQYRMGDPPVSAPSITLAADDETGTSATLTLDAGNERDVLSVYYRASAASTWTLFGATRTGDGELQITGLSTLRYQFIAIAARGGMLSLPSDPVFLAVTNGSRITAGRAIREILIADTGVSTLIGRRIYAQHAPQGAVLPYIVATRVSATRFPHMGGAWGQLQVRIQLDFSAADSTAARALAEAVRFALDGYSDTVTVADGHLDISSITLDGDADDWSPPTGGDELGEDGVTHDCLVWCDEATS